MKAKSLTSYQKVAQECIEAFNRVDMRREEGYCVRSGLFSANLTNFLPNFTGSQPREYVHEACSVTCPSKSLIAN